VEEKIETMRRESTRLFWTGIVVGALFFQVSPILTLRRPWLAAFLTDDELDLHANALATHPVYLVRQLTVLLKVMAGLFWGESPEIRAFIHLPAYGDDPKTRRAERHVPPVLAPIRAPVDALVTLGRHERERGRGKVVE